MAPHLDGVVLDAEPFGDVGRADRVAGHADSMGCNATVDKCNGWRYGGDMTNTKSTEPFQVHRGGPHCWYIREVATGDLKALPFRTRRAAQEAVDGWNARRA